MGVNEVKENQDYHSSVNQSLNRPPVMKAFDWLKEKQFYQVSTFLLFTLKFLASYLYF
jgi:hypothetical protein